MNGALLRRLAVVACAAVLGACSGADTKPLPQLDLDPDRIAVAGLSAGAYMATQTHLAWPEVFSGAALVAGGPWGCAGGDLTRALGSCMAGTPPIAVDGLVERARMQAAQGAIGALDALAGDRVFVLHGRSDTTVAAPVAQAAAAFYRALATELPGAAPLEVTLDAEHDFGHNLPVVARGDGCLESASPWLGRCGLDAAAMIFARLYGAPPRAADTAAGELLPFAQALADGSGKAAQMADTGWLYLPAACREGARCGVLVAFHGCQQNADGVGDAFTREAGFNRWADAYDVVVVYPQVRASFVPLNPNACWDWWGYTGADYEARSGAQQRWLRDALGALGVRFPAP